MENKYYTPEIGEFHVGFEFEVNYGENDWRKEKLYYKPEVVTLPYMKLENIRVKYLDKEDIESLGWLLKWNEVGELCFELNNYILIFWNIKSKEYKTNLYIKQQTGLGLHSFKGECKNKSELKKLIKQLNIV